MGHSVRGAQPDDPVGLSWFDTPAARRGDIEFYVCLSVVSTL